MGKTVRALLAVVALTQASAAAAQVSFDVKAAYALPMGNAWVGSPWNPAQPMTSSWTGAIPFEIAARYHVSPAASLGLYFQWGPAFTKSGGLVPSWTQDTSGSDMRVGLQLMYEIAPAAALNPWFSLGTGWEWTSYSIPGGSVTLNGWEWLNVQVGLDFKVVNALGVGPYVGYFGGYYAGMSTTGSAEGAGGSIPTFARAFHGWLQIGLKGTLNL